MRLFLLRHGIAEPGTSQLRDFDRALTPEGRAELDIIGHALRRLDVAPRLILTSPLVRARETAELVASVLGATVEIADQLSSGATFDQFLDLLRRFAAADALMLVGHEPDFSAAAARWIGAHGDALVLKKAGLIRIDLDGRNPGKHGWLRWLLTPRQLRLIGAGTTTSTTGPEQPGDDDERRGEI